MSMKRPGLTAQSFVLYYGYGPISGITTFDLAILEPAGWSAAHLSALDASGVRRLAYLSVMEASEQIYYRAHLTRDDLLRADGRPWYKEPYDTWVVDPRSMRWRSYVRSQIDALLAARWAGLLLDTVGDVEDLRVHALGHWLLPATADLVGFIRAAVGDRLLVQNSGLFLLLPLTAPLLNGICWEGPPAAPEHTDPSIRLAWESVLEASALHGLTPMLLANIPPGPDEAEALDALAVVGQRYGCLTYAAPGDYTSGIRLPDRRIVQAPR